jgi:hypothetical protein
MSDQPRGHSSRSDVEMSSPATWGNDQKLKAALDELRGSVDRLEAGNKPKGLEDHVATIEAAADGLLEVVKVGSSGQEVRGYIAQFNTKVAAAKRAIDGALAKRNLSVGLAVSVLESVERLDKLAQTL